MAAVAVSRLPWNKADSETSCETRRCCIKVKQ